MSDGNKPDRNAVPTVNDAPEALTEVLPKTGLVFSEKSTMVEILCKPKLMPIKSAALIRLETLEREAVSTLNEVSRVATAMGHAAAPASSMGRPIQGSTRL